MGLDEFLIPTPGPSSPRDVPSTHGLDDLLVVPPLPPEPATTPDAVDEADAPRAASPSGVPTSTSPAPRLVPSPPPPDLRESIAAAELPLIEPAEIDEPRASTNPARVDQPVVHAARRPPAPPVLDALQLDGFLASTRVDEGRSSTIDVAPLGDDESILAPSDLFASRIESFRSSSAPVGTFQSPGLTVDPWMTVPTDSLASSRHVLATSSDSDPFAPRAGVEDYGAAFDRMESRLERMAETLERAVERLSSPPNMPLGSRPRSFRGRVDA